MQSTERTLKLGLQLHEARRFDEARQCYRKVLRVDPEHADANHLLGLLAYQKGEHDVAISQIQKALAKRPASAQYLNSIGAAYRAAGRPAQAQAVFERAIEIQSNYAEPCNNLGTVLFEQGRFAEAEKWFHKALALNSKFVDAYVNLGGLQHALHHFDAAEKSLRAALALAPHHPLAWNNLGNVYKSRERMQEAIDCYTKALQSDANYAACWGNLALSLQAQGDWHRAVEAFDRSYALKPAAGLLVKRALALPVIAESTAQLDEARRRFDVEVDRILNSDLKVDDPHREAGVCVFHLAYHGINDRDRYCRVAQMFRHISPRLDYTAPHCQTEPSQTGGRKRVAFISQFFHNHSISRHFAGLIRHLPRERCRVLLLRFPGSGDDTARTLAESADEAITLSPDLFKAREQIADLKLDLLYYTDIGMDPLTYFLAFARLARVQCVSAGHPVTTGIPTLDYFISCEAVEPADAQQHYSERLVRMRSIPNYFDRPHLSGPVPARRDFGLSDDWHVYMCAQNLCKLHPDFDLVMGQILRRDPQGRVILFHGAEPAWSERLAERLRRSIPDVAERVGFLPHQCNDRFLHLLTLADAVLDSTHFNGGTTSAQALGVGAPIVTWPGEFMRARQCYCNYHHMGMFDCVARNADDYAQIVVRLGTDPAYRAALRSKILSRNSVLFNNPAYAHELEAFFAQALDRPHATA
ncbi:MAG TPA: tetratricopeptide repeat protein [Planctomycetaceae bacterium]|nr:tetratricopeptide repeat protein [Planctomycetaceae bacterium]